MRQQAVIVALSRARSSGRAYEIVLEPATRTKTPVEGEVKDGAQKLVTGGASNIATVDFVSAERLYGAASYSKPPLTGADGRNKP